MLRGEEESAEAPDESVPASKCSEAEGERETEEGGKQNEPERSNDSANETPSPNPSESGSEDEPDTLSSSTADKNSFQNLFEKIERPDSSLNNTETAQKPMHLQTENERRQSMNRVTSDIKEYFKEESSGKAFLSRMLDLKKLKNIAGGSGKDQGTSKSSSKNRRNTWLGAADNKNAQTKTDESPANLKKYLHRPSWYDKEDILPISSKKGDETPPLEVIDEETEHPTDEDVYKDLDEELRTNPQTVIRLDTTLQTIADTTNQPRRDSRRSTGWLGSDGSEEKSDDDDDVRPKLQKYSHRPSWYDNHEDRTLYPETSRKIDEEKAEEGKFGSSEEKDEETEHPTDENLYRVLAEELRKNPEAVLDSSPDATNDTKKEPERKSRRSTAWLRSKEQDKKRESVLPELQAGRLPKGFVERFKHFAMAPTGGGCARSEDLEDVPSDQPTISLPGADRWLERGNILDHSNLTVIHTGFCFHASTSKNKRRLEMEDFLKFLMKISKIKKISLAETTRLLSTCPFGDDKVPVV